MAIRPDVMWLNGTIVVNQTEVGVLKTSDGPVETSISPQQIHANGVRGIDLYTDEVKNDITIDVTGTFWDMKILEYLQGLVASYGYLENGTSPSKNYSQDTQCNSINRPYIELLLRGYKKGTTNPLNDNKPYEVQIWALRAKLLGALAVPWSKSEHTKAKLTFKVHGDPDDETTVCFQIRDEEMQS